jgi:hypothetical protein
MVNERYPTYNTVTAPTTQYEMPDEQLRWQPPICLICKERKNCHTALPWGSEYDGDIICGDCCHKYFDPAIKAALAEKEGKNDT